MDRNCEAFIKGSPFADIIRDVSSGTVALRANGSILTA